MKWKLFLCVAVLGVAGCASEQNPYATFGNNSFTYDLVPKPVPGLTAQEAQQIMSAPLPVSQPTPDVTTSQGSQALPYYGR